MFYSVIISYHFANLACLFRLSQKDQNMSIPPPFVADIMCEWLLSQIDRRDKGQKNMLANLFFSIKINILPKKLFFLVIKFFWQIFF